MGAAIKVFLAPGELFEELRDDPRWAGPLLVGGVVVVASTVLVPTEAWESMLREQVMASGQDLESLETLVGFIRIFGGVGALVFWFLWAVAMAALATVVFAFVLGDDGRFRQYFAVTCHSMLILALGALVTLPLKIVEMDPQLTLNVGTFAVFLDDGYAYRVLRALDLFGIWSLVVMGVGVSKVEPRRSWGSATVVLLTIFVAFAMLVAIPSPPGG